MKLRSSGGRRCAVRTAKTRRISVSRTPAGPTNRSKIGVGLPGEPTPIFDRFVGPAGVLLTLILLVFAVRTAHLRPPLERSFIWLGFWSYGLVIAIRLFVSNGAELSARALTFTALFTALATATVLGQLSSAMSGRHHRLPRFRTKPLMATLLAITLFLGSV